MSAKKENKPQVNEETTNKKRAIDAAVALIEKNHGKGSIDKNDS
jgi:hypothetical protein